MRTPAQIEASRRKANSPEAPSPTTEKPAPPEITQSTASPGAKPSSSRENPKKNGKSARRLHRAIPARQRSRTRNRRRDRRCPPAHPPLPSHRDRHDQQGNR